MSTTDLDNALGRALIACARDEIARALRIAHAVLVPDHPRLTAHGATFVTLTQSGRLRGCIGTLSAHRTLVADVRANAAAAAFRDPRFAPLSAPEFTRTQIGVSLLGASQPMAVQSEEDALAQFQPHEDGIVLAWRQRRATFLPQVWDSLPHPRDFLRELKRKAGLPVDFWSDEIELSRYRVAKWEEAETDISRAAAGL